MQTTFEFPDPNDEPTTESVDSMLNVFDDGRRPVRYSSAETESVDVMLPMFDDDAGGNDA